MSQCDWYNGFIHTITVYFHNKKVMLVNLFEYYYHSAHQTGEFMTDISNLKN